MPMKCVLIVDDALDLGRMLRAALQTLDTGLDIRVIPSAEEALLEITRRPVELLVSDIRLPGMSGFDLLKKARARRPEMRSILITGLSDDAVIRQAQESGADRFMRKPIQVADFIDVVAELLDLTPVKLPLDSPPVSPPAGEPPADPEQLSHLLTRLRRELGAQQVLLADDRGRIVAQAGEMSALEFESRWTPVVMAALSAAAKISRQVRSGLPLSTHAFQGDEYNLLLAPVGDYALVILQSADASGLRTALSYEAMLQAQVDLARALQAMAVDFYSLAESAHQVQPSVPPEQEQWVEETTLGVSEAPMDDFAASLEQSGQALQGQSAEEFWETAAEAGEGALEDPDIISYEQARQLGLTPEDQ